MWKVNQTTFEFEDLNPFTWCELKELCTNVLRRGEVNVDHPAFKEWAKAYDMPGVGDRLLMAQTFTPKTLLSLLENPGLSHERMRLRYNGGAPNYHLKVGEEYWGFRKERSEARLDVWSLAGDYLGYALIARFERIP